MDARDDKLEELIKKFEEEYGTRNPRLVENLRDLIERSPAIKADMQKAAEDGSLKEIKLLDSNQNNTGGEYSKLSGTILIPEHDLANAHTAHRYDEDMIFKLGHEVRHAIDRANGLQDNEKFNQETWRISEEPGSRHDYTQVVADFIRENRESESYAHIGGFNAISSMVRAENPNATLKDIYAAHPKRMEDFIEASGTLRKKYSLKGELSVDENMQMAYSSANVDEMKKLYFDKPPEVAKLGPNQDWDYRHYYGNEAFRRIAIAEQEVATYRQQNGEPNALPATVTADLASIGLDPRKISPEHHVIDAPRPVQQKTPEPLEPNPRTNQLNGVREAEKESAPSGVAQAIERLSPQEREVYDRGFAAVKARGGYDDEQAQNIAAAGVLAFNESKSTLVAHNVGIYADRLRTTYMPYGPDKEPNFPADVKLAVAAQVPAERSLQQNEDLTHIRSQEQARQRDVVAQDPSQSGPSIGPRLT